MICKLQRLLSVWILLWLTAAAVAQTDDNGDSSSVENSEEKKERNFVVVPIPLSNPTLDTGLIIGAAYFYPQTPVQKAAQAASVTVIGGMYTNNDSYAYGIGQQIYWKEDTWRFSGGIGYADLSLELSAPDGPDSVQSAAWNLRGGFAQLQVSRRIHNDWYLGVVGRYIDGEQSIEPLVDSPDFSFLSELKSAGLGLELEYDSRDMPINPYSGRIFEAGASINDQSTGRVASYEAYSLAYRSYHELTKTLVLAWQVEGCLKSDSVPLWDACRLGLRGFSGTDYLGKASGIGQVEARWRMSKKWGLVGFAGAGILTEPFSRFRESEWIPSYGIGLRYMVLPSERINIRLDYGFSTDSNAIHLSVGEAF